MNWFFLSSYTSVLRFNISFHIRRSYIIISFEREIMQDFFSKISMVFVVPIISDTNGICQPAGDENISE